MAAPAPTGSGDLTDEQVRRATPYGIGCQRFPVNAATALDATVDVDAARKEWEALVGTLFGPSGVALGGAVSHSCDEIFGEGNCESDFTAAQVARQTKWKKMLIALQKFPPEVFDEMELPPCWCIYIPSAAAGSADGAREGNKG